MNLLKMWPRLTGNKIQRRRLFVLLVILTYMAVLTYVSLYPVPPATELSARVRLINNLLHVPAYAVLTALWIAYLRLRWRKASDWRVLLPAFLIACGYGGLMELAQFFVPGRFASLQDTFYNMCGALWTVVAVLIFPTGEEMSHMNGARGGSGAGPTTTP